MPSNATGQGGTVIITGANGSLGLACTQYLLQQYPAFTAVLTVRNDSKEDPNTVQLRETVSSCKDSKSLVEVLDLSSLSNVRSFASNLARRVSTKELPPISAIICNAFSWSLIRQTWSKDQNDLCFQASHLSHFLLVVMLLGSMNKTSGRVVMLGSVAHDSANKNGMNPLGAALPNNFEELLKPTPDKAGEEQARGFQRYGNAKLANVMFMYALNRKLLQTPTMENITAVAIDPGNMPSSRAFSANIPFSMKAMMKVLGYVAPILGMLTDQVTYPKSAGSVVAKVSVDPSFSGVRGYLNGQKQAESSQESRDEKKQDELWAACMKWAGLKESETVFGGR